MAHELSSKLTDNQIEQLQAAASDPKEGIAFAYGCTCGLLTVGEFNEATSFTWCDDSFYECRQMMACFVLLANDIPLEV
jgi:hypothetical protein